jgi:hypothetical protein
VLTHCEWKIYSPEHPLDIVTEYLADSDLLVKLEIASREGVPVGDYFQFLSYSLGSTTRDSFCRRSQLDPSNL